MTEHLPPSNSQSDPSRPDPRKALAAARLVWTIILASPVFFGLFFALFLFPDQPDPDAKEFADLLLYINFGLLAVGLMVGYVLRNQFYKRYWVDDVVQPQGYFMGNLLVWSIAEGCAIFSIVISLIAGEYLPYLWPGIGGMVSIVINFPNGRIMFPPRDFA